MHWGQVWVLNQEVAFPFSPAGCLFLTPKVVLIPAGGHQDEAVGSQVMDTGWEGRSEVHSDQERMKRGNQVAC